MRSIRIEDLRENIKNKYKEYHSFDKDRFPDIEYNTNRANYEPLRESFEEEFYVVRKLDRTKNSIHIPSTATLALIFCDNNYIPSKKILATCYSYAENNPLAGLSRKVLETDQSKSFKLSLKYKILLTSFPILILLAVYTIFNQRHHQADGLLIYHPYDGQVVPRLSFIDGRVSGADTVWVVVRAVEGTKYWVQPPIKVSNNKWKGRLYVGSVDKGDIGVRVQIQAFVYPSEHLKVGDVLSDWPKAQLGSEVVEATRGPDPVLTP